MAVKGIKNFDKIFADPEFKYLHPDVVRMWENSNPHKMPDYGQFLVLETIPWHRRFAKALNAAGVPLLLGTDAAAAGVFPGKSAHQELRHLVDVSLTPFEALLTGTRNAGQFIKKHIPSAESFGMIVVGYRADLILLDANPLEDINNTTHILGVMVRGNWLTKAELEKRRNDFASRYKAAR
jgi:imidazolonepropionase-like amidohydrolase